MANGLLGDPTALRGLLQSPSTTDFALAMLANSGYSPRRRSLGEIVGASMLQSRQMAAEQAQQKLREEYMRAQIAAMQQRQEPRPEDYKMTVGPDGRPVWTPTSKLEGTTPYIAERNGGRDSREIEIARTLNDPETPEPVKRDLRKLLERMYRPAAPPQIPAAIATYEHWRNLPTDQAREDMLGTMRQQQIFEAGGVPTLNIPGVGTRPLSTPQAEQDAAFGAAAATAAGTAAGQAEATGDKKAANARGVIDLLADAEALIDRSTAGAIDTAKDAALGRLNISTPGQQAIAELQIIQSSLIQNMPRMEGPQSDKDVELYRQAAGQIANPLLPREVRKTAVRRIITLNQKYANSPTGARRRPNNAPVDILAEAEAELRNGR